MRRVVIIGVGVLALAAVAYAAIPGLLGGKSAEYRTDPVTRGDVSQTITANGTLRPLTVVNVGAQISGRIKALHADFNDKVTEGQLLAELDDSSLKAQLAQSEAELASAQAQLKLAQVSYERARNLAARGAGAKATFDEAAANLGIAEAAVGSAQARVEIDRVNLSYTVINSPVSGVVMSRDVDVGQTVAASLSAPQLYSIAQDLSLMEIDTTVAEADVGAIKAGMPATFRVDAFPNRSFSGSVKQVRLNAKNESNVVSYNVVLEFANTDLTLLPGMTAYVQIAVAAQTDTLRVANAALRFTPPGSGEEGGQRRRRGGGEQSAGRTVYVLDGGTPRQVTVQTGISDGKVTAVTSEELKEGDEVITGVRSAEAPAAQGQGGQGRGMGRMF
ncbi:MAG: efflux RND transporter periplasmic adaptor subunit [Alphaproteobacteria bacterium]|nr:efflux RND transporter periplasmic adaptor subunit [Alphaproteobacteria bacterium]